MDEVSRKIRETLRKPTVLVGMMGCGKSHVGQALAAYLDMPFFDSDAEIEKTHGSSIQKIFEKEGERVFRDLEEAKIAELLDGKSPCVISTGGGALMREETLKKISAQAISIWVRCDVDTIYERVKDDTARPLLQNDDPRGVLVSLLERREGLYKQADIHVDNMQQGIKPLLETIGQEVLQRL